MIVLCEADQPHQRSSTVVLAGVAATGAVGPVSSAGNTVDGVRAKVERIYVSRPG